MTEQNTKLHPTLVKHLRHHAQELDERIEEIYAIELDADDLKWAVADIQKKCASALTNISYCLHDLALALGTDLTEEADEE